MSYVDALFDRDSDIIRTVERKDGKRHFHEYQAKYTFYYKDPRGKYKSVYGDPLTRVVCKNTKDFRKEVAINKGKDLFESDINPTTYITVSPALRTIRLRSFQSIPINTHNVLLAIKAYMYQGYILNAAIVAATSKHAVANQAKG